MFDSFSQAPDHPAHVLAEARSQRAGEFDRSVRGAASVSATRSVTTAMRACRVKSSRNREPAGYAPLAWNCPKWGPFAERPLSGDKIRRAAIQPWNAANLLGLARSGFDCEPQQGRCLWCGDQQGRAASDASSASLMELGVRRPVWLR
jgi:hypothetical protein